MSTQLTGLNQNISPKNARIRRTYPGMARVRVYIILRVWRKDTREIVHNEEIDPGKGHIRKFKSLVNKYDAQYVKQVLRIQTGGYVGGIILSGHTEIVHNVAC